MKRVAVYTRAALLAVLFAFAIAAQEPGGAPEALGREAAKEYGHKTDLSTWKAYNFILFAGVLGWFLYKKGGPFFRERTKQIQQGIVEASEIRKDAEARYKAMEERLASLGVEIEKLRQASREESTTESERMREETRRELMKIQAQAEHEIASAGKAASRELRAFSAELAVALARERIRERMSAGIEDRLVEATIQQLERVSEQQKAVEAS